MKKAWFVLNKMIDGDGPLFIVAWYFVMAIALAIGVGCVISIGRFITHPFTNWYYHVHYAYSIADDTATALIWLVFIVMLVWLMCCMAEWYKNTLKPSIKHAAEQYEAGIIERQELLVASNSFDSDPRISIAEQKGL